VVVNASSALRCISRTLFVVAETHAKACVWVGLVHTSSMQERPTYMGHVVALIVSASEFVGERDKRGSHRSTGRAGRVSAHSLGLTSS
jgi:hypothetical protein